MRNTKYAEFQNKQFDEQGLYLNSVLKNISITIVMTLLTFRNGTSRKVMLNIDVSYLDHSKLIGAGGEVVDSVKKETECQIHFPDINRSNQKVKSNVYVTSTASIQIKGDARHEADLIEGVRFLFDRLDVSRRDITFETILKFTRSDYSFIKQRMNIEDVAAKTTAAFEFDHFSQEATDTTISQLTLKGQLVDVLNARKLVIGCLPVVIKFYTYNNNLIHFMTLMKEHDVGIMAECLPTISGNTKVIVKTHECNSNQLIIIGDKLINMDSCEKLLPNPDRTENEQICETSGYGFIGNERRHYRGYLLEHYKLDVKKLKDIRAAAILDRYVTG
ncbi:Protein bicaudal C 1 [Nymphon striatum]|nr:Protein bicaudal C 1 [Nymphon striatum]